MIIVLFKLISRQCFISIPSENVRKTKGFLTFYGGTEMKCWDKMGQIAFKLLKNLMVNHFHHRWKFSVATGNNTFPEMTSKVKNILV